MTTMRLDRPRVLADVLPGGTLRDVALVVGAALFVGLAAQLSIPLPFTPVPLSGQTFVVLVAGAALGATRGALGMLIYAAAGAAGVPWLAQHEAGWAFASFGYVLGFIPAALVLGVLARHGADRSPGRTVPLMIAGTLVIYSVGVPWLMIWAHLGLADALVRGVLPFVVGDGLKIALAAALLPAAWLFAEHR